MVPELEQAIKDLQRQIEESKRQQQNEMRIASECLSKLTHENHSLKERNALLEESYCSLKAAAQESSLLAEKD